MAFDVDFLQHRLARLAADGTPARYVVAFSGGLDSTVLLHAMAASGNATKARILAVHVNHGLHACAHQWQRHSHDFAKALGVSFQAVEVEVVRQSGRGIEAEARAQRYAVLAALLTPGDWLLSAHHRDDQAETLMLNLLRGSGAAGLAGIAASRPLGAGLLVRPLLDVSRGELRDYAEASSLRWLEDPSNAESQFDRNFLRHDVLPVLAARWPAAGARLARSAALAGEASALLHDLADLDLQRLGEPSRFAVSGLSELSEARQRNVIRRALSRCGLAPAPETRLSQIVSELIPAREDAEPMVRWADVAAHRYRGYLYLHKVLTDVPVQSTIALAPANRALSLGELGSLHLTDGQPGGIRPDIVAGGLQVRYRAGGESVSPGGRNGRRKLKKLFQEKGVVPWMRQNIPLLYAGERLIAVADLLIDEEFACPRGFGVEWRNHPVIF